MRRTWELTSAMLRSTLQRTCSPASRTSNRRLSPQALPRTVFCASATSTTLGKQVAHRFAASLPSQNDATAVAATMVIIHVHIHVHLHLHLHLAPARPRPCDHNRSHHLHHHHHQQHVHHHHHHSSEHWQKQLPSSVSSNLSLKDTPSRGSSCSTVPCIPVVAFSFLCVARKVVPRQTHRLKC